MFNLNLKAFNTLNSWTQTFSDTYSSFEEFVADYDTFSALTVIPFEKKDEFLLHIYLLLMGEYSSNNLSNMSVDQFKIRFWTRVNQYGPQYERELKMQKELVQMKEADLMASSSVIYNSAINPATTVSDPSSELIEEINTQNTTFHKRSKLDAYAYLRDLLDDGINLTKDFVAKFKDLFTVVLVGPELLYKTYLNSTETEE